MNNLIIDLPEEILVVGLAATLVLTTLVALRSWWVILPIMLVVGIVEVQLGVNPTFELASYNILPIDVLTLGLLIAYGIRVLLIGRIAMAHLCWLGLSGLMILGLVRGIATYGLTTAVVAFRQDFYFIALALYMQSFQWEPRDLDRFASIWMWASGLLSGYALLCWIDPSFVILRADPTSSFFARDAFLGWRVLPASSALLIAESGLIAALLWLRPGRIGPRHLAAVPLLMITMMLYHRSVWIASLVALSLLGLHRPAQLSRLLLPMIIVGIGMAALMSFGGDMLVGAVQSAAAEPFRDNSTWAWRVNNWQTMVPETIAAGPSTILMGWGYGASFEDQLTGVVLANPHNAYVAFFLNLGLAGLAMLLICCLMPLWRIVRHDDFPAGRTFDRLTGIALLGLLISYYVPYSISFDHGILLGLLSSLGAARTATAPDEPEEPDEAQPTAIE